MSSSTLGHYYGKYCMSERQNMRGMAKEIVALNKMLSLQIVRPCKIKILLMNYLILISKIVTLNKLQPTLIIMIM